MNERMNQWMNKICFHLKKKKKRKKKTFKSKEESSLIKKWRDDGKLKYLIIYILLSYYKTKSMLKMECAFFIELSPEY